MYKRQEQRVVEGIVVELGHRAEIFLEPLGFKKLLDALFQLCLLYTSDTGIVCIIDRRLRDEPPERYHDITWDSLPIKNRTSSLEELRKFYEGLPSAKE